ncbi:MAG: 2-dehydro-3-deoxygalactonokinase [Segetibacter sp.]
MNNFLLGCDWGTSSFRLRLLDVPGQSVIGEVVSDMGIAGMYESWQKRNEENKTITREQLFREYLKKQIEELSPHTSVKLEHVTILISGMASSSIGMEDIAYAKVPFAINGSGAIIKRFAATDNFLHDIVLISGVRSENDVMRGEETQVIGLLSLLKSSRGIPQEGVFIFPGTHSKHIYIQNGELLKFQTFMTGELFKVMSQHSILKDSVQVSDLNNFSDDDANAFKLGLQEAKGSNILNGLFTVRTNQLFEKLDKKQNYFYLSGLLIGSEISYFLNKNIPILLCSGSNLHEYYKLAIDEYDLSESTTIIPNELVDKAALEGQRLIFEKHVLKDLANESKEIFVGFI